MSFEFGPKPKGTEGSETKKEMDYEPIRFKTGWKALAGLDVGLLHSMFSKEEPTLKSFAQKCLGGYQAMEKAGKILDEAFFKSVTNGVQDEIKKAKTEEDREALSDAFEEMKKAREEKLREEQVVDEAVDSIFNIFKKAFEK